MHCEHCRAITAGTDVDVIEIDAASNRGIEEIRDLRESTRFVPAHSRKKIFIIDEAHMLTAQVIQRHFSRHLRNSGLRDLHSCDDGATEASRDDSFTMPEV